MRTTRLNKRRAKHGSAQTDLWIITFSDLSTLLMALFV
ncbi:MAG: flagellar motor protein MotB, partial [Deltaproteobacteria bacterium]|nr:flagellar motor protein MotB [Deltaproteobacteria bacterium]